MSKRAHEDVTKGMEEEEDWDGGGGGGADRRKHKSSKSRKQHGNAEDVEEQRGDGGSKRGSGDSRKRVSSGSNRADSGDEEDYDVRRDLRLKVSKRNIDVETESGSRKGRNNESERGYSKKTSTKTSGHDGDSQSGKNRSRVERGLHDAEYEKVQDKDSRYVERKDGSGSREKGHSSRDQERNVSRRRWDEVDPGRKNEENAHGERSESRNAKAIADTPSFIFLWVGDGVGLEQGRQCLKKWGFRRCEDICWVKTNKLNAAPSLRHDSHTLFQHSKEHCLMGIKGTVRRSTDGHIIHANIDTDIIIAEEPPYGSTTKPEDIYRIIEHFSLGRRRLELFGAEHNIRSGWLTVGKDLSSSNFDSKAYCENFADKDGKVWQGGGGRNPPPDAPHLVLTTPDIESLRPKSPPAKNQQPQPSISTTANSSKRPPAPLIPQQPIPTVPSLLSINQEVSSSNPPAILPPQPWSTSPMPLQTGINAPASCPSNDGSMFLDNYGFNP